MREAVRGTASLTTPLPSLSSLLRFSLLLRSHYSASTTPLRLRNNVYPPGEYYYDPDQNLSRPRNMYRSGELVDQGERRKRI